MKPFVHRLFVATLLILSACVTQAASLSWTPPAGAVQAYRVYWGTASRDYSQVFGHGVDTTVPALVTSGLTPGVRYYFAVTSIDGAGKESPYSDENSFVEGTLTGQHHYYRPGTETAHCPCGDGSGSSWKNAAWPLPSLSRHNDSNGLPDHDPQAGLVRGDTYWLGAGDYGVNVFFDDEDGKKTISLIKATSARHGPAPDWKNAYGHGPVVFTHLDLYTGYYVFDGQQRDATWRYGDTAKYGMRIKSHGDKAINIDDSAQGGNRVSHHDTFRYIDMVGGGRDTGNLNDYLVYGLKGNVGMTIQYSAMRDSGAAFFNIRELWDQVTLDHNYIARNTSSEHGHGDGISFTDVSNWVISNNVFEDVEGSGVIAAVNGGRQTHLAIFGNTFVSTPAYLRDEGRHLICIEENGTCAYLEPHSWGISGAALFEAETTTTDAQFWHNTIAGIKSATHTGFIAQANNDNMVANNAWYDSSVTDNGGAKFAGNWYYHTAPGDDTSPSRVICDSNCDVFSDIDGGAHNARDLHLKAPLAKGIVPPAATPHRSAINVDPDGKIRGRCGARDIGTFEYCPSGSYSALQPPKDIRFD